MVAIGPKTWNANVTAVDGDAVTLDVRGKWINYPSILAGQVSWAPIDLNFRAMGDRWRVDASPWAVECPLLATGRFIAANQRCWDVHEATTVVGDAPQMEIQHIGARPVEGILLPGREWQVVYPSALDDVIDIAISQWPGRGPRQEHLYIFRGMPSGNSEFVEISAKIRTNGHIPDWQGDPLSIADGASVVLPTDVRLGYGIRPAVGWYYDANGAMHVQPIDVVVERKVDHVLLTKRIPRSLIASALAAREGGELRVDQTLTVSPDPDVETTTVDGHVGRASANSTWSSLRDGAGNDYGDSNTTNPAPLLLAGSLSGRWSKLYRFPFLFDLSAAPAGATWISGSVAIYCEFKPTGSSAIDLALTSCSLASNTTIVAADYAGFGTTELASRVLNSGVTNNTYMTFTLNASGVAYLERSVRGFGMRTAADFDNVAPAWDNGRSYNYTVRYADYAGAGSDPVGTFTYSMGGGGGGGNRRRRLLLAGIR